MIYFSLDPGKSFIGVAISLDGQFVDPLVTVPQKNYLPKLLDLIRVHRPDQIIIGTPPYGSVSSIARQIASELSTHTEVPVKLVDEDLSSVKSQARLIESGASLFKRKKLNHAAAAAQILEDYLDTLP